MAKTTTKKPAEPEVKQEEPIGEVVEIVGVEEATTLLSKPGVRLTVMNSDGTEIIAAVELSQERVDDLLLRAASLGMSSRESMLAHVLHEWVMAKFAKLPNVD